LESVAHGLIEILIGALQNYLQMHEKQKDKIEKASVHKTAFMTFSCDAGQDVRVSSFPKAP